MIYKSKHELKLFERRKQEEKDNNWRNGHRSVNSKQRNINFYKAVKENHHIGEFT